MTYPTVMPKGVSALYVTRVGAVPKLRRKGAGASMPSQGVPMKHLGAPVPHAKPIKKEKRIAKALRQRIVDRFIEGCKKQEAK